GGYYGYNSYWNGLYDGYYYGSGGDYGYGGRNVVYVRNGNDAYRGNSYNNVVRSKSSTTTRKSTTASNNVNPNRNTRTAGNDPRNTTRTASTRNTVASSRFNDKNLSASRVSDRNSATINRTPTTRAAQQGYKSNTSSYVKTR